MCFWLLRVTESLGLLYKAGVTCDSSHNPCPQDKLVCDLLPLIITQGDIKRRSVPPWYGKLVWYGMVWLVLLTIKLPALAPSAWVC